VAKIIDFWNHLSIRQKVLSLMTIICLIIFIIITSISNHMIAGLSDQQAAKRWDKDNGSSQVSVFVAGDVSIDELKIKNFQMQLEAALKEAAITADNANGRLYVDAYSSQGEVTINGSQSNMDTKAMGIGGDFFLFHPVKLVDGSYFSGNDLMKDFILLDEEAAWRLFGSNDIAGMNVTISGIPHYIAGVYEKEEGRFQEAAGLNESVVFLSHENLSQYGKGDSISTYELIAPNPIKNFVYNTVKEKFGLQENEMIVVENSSRYSWESIIPVLFDFGIRSMHNTKVRFPYWENIARGYEDVRALLFLFQMIFLMIPMVIICAFIMVKGRKFMRSAGEFIKKKISVMSFILFCAILLSGCATDKGTETSAASSKDYVYRVEELQLEESGEQQGKSLLKKGDKLYMYSYNWGNGEPDAPWIDFWALNADGTVKEKTKFPIGENGSLNSLCPDGKGNIYAVKYIYPMEPDENGMYIETYFLQKMTEQGDVLFSVELNSMPELEVINSQDYFYTGDMIYSDGFLYINIMDQYVKFDENGNFVKILETGGENGLQGGTLFALENGKTVVLTYEDTGCYVAYVDLENGVTENKTKLPGTSYEYSVYAGYGYDLYLVNSYGVYGYNVGDEDKTQIMNYIDSDMGIYSVFNVVPINDTSFLATYDDMESGDILVGKFSKVNPEDVKEKVNLTLACAGLNWDVRTAIVKFNKSNEQYRIRIEDYSSLYGSETDYMAGINRLNADIVAGKVPDILLIDSGMPVDSYIAKGLFEDLKPYLEADTEIDYNSFMPNIIEAYSVDGKLYQLIPSFMIRTLVAKASDVGEEKGWTIDEAKQVLEKKPEGTEFLTNTTRDNVLNNCIATGDEFIDWKTGKCNFDSKEFVSLLEFVKIFPETYDESVYNEDYWMNYEYMWREGTVLCQEVYLYDFRNYNYVEKGTFGEKITMIGYPMAEGDGACIVPDMQLAMSAKSKNKDGAYEFLRYFLTDEYQNEISFGLPLSMKRLDAMAEEATKIRTYEDENGNQIESPEYFYMNDIEIEIPPMTADEVKKLKENICSVTDVYSYNENLNNIIGEETAAYFAGQKSAQDVAAIIQSRVQIYVNENR